MRRYLEEIINWCMVLAGSNQGSANPPEPFPPSGVSEENIQRMGGAPWDTRITNNSTNNHFFRDDEQTSSWIPVRNQGQAWSAGR